MSAHRCRSALITAPLALALLVGTGCGPSQLGAAAIVGDERISVAQIQDTVAATRILQEEQSVLVRGPQLAARREVQRRVLDQIFLRAAHALGVEVTDTEIAGAIDAQRSELGGQPQLLAALAANGLNLGQLSEVFRSQVLIAKIEAKLAGGAQLSQSELDARLLRKLSEVAAGMRIKINPRYGTFDSAAVGLRANLPDYFRATAPR